MTHGLLCCTLGVTAAGLVPPYLTIPLTDMLTSLRPSRRRPVCRSWSAGIWLAWPAPRSWPGCSRWGQGIVMAWVSERISADLRNQTYAHLQRLSLEFFGGKRTGDLMSRISSDTERICNFLSINLVDFATDVLMIVGTAVILLAIDPLLALATLLPFPFIAWLVYHVRDQHAARLSARRPGLGGR